MKRKLARQSKFREDGSLTDVPAELTENPELEQQGDLLLHGEESEKLRKSDDRSTLRFGI